MNIKNQDKIKKALAKAQGRATVRRIQYDDILNAVEVVEGHLGRLLYKKDWVDVVVDVDPNAQQFPSAYKYPPESTQIRLKRTSRGWCLVAVARDYTKTPLNRYVYTGLEEKAQEIARFVSRHV